MARTDSLSNYLTDVATAIKEKKGDNTPILASDFDTEITNLPSGGGRDWGQIGYIEEPETINDGFEYAKEIYDNWDASIMNRSSAFANDYNLIYFPNVDMSNVTNCASMFENSAIEYFDTIEPSSIRCNMSALFYSDNIKTVLKGKKLVVMPSATGSIIRGYKKVEIDDLYLYYGYNDTQYVFSTIQNLKIKKITGRETSRQKQVLSNCTMDDDTIKEFLKYFKTLVNQTTTYKTLRKMGFTQANCDQAILLDEWADLESAGWITGY